MIEDVFTWAWERDRPGHAGDDLTAEEIEDIAEGRDIWPAFEADKPRCVRDPLGRRLARLRMDAGLWGSDPEFEAWCEAAVEGCWSDAYTGPRLARLVLAAEREVTCE